MKQYNYEITWYTQKGKEFTETLSQEVQMTLPKLEKKLGNCQIERRSSASTYWNIGIIANTQLNLGKLVRMLEKGLPYTFMQKVDTSKTMIISMPHDKAMKDQRLEKLISSIQDVGYYDLHEYFSGDLEAFKDYLLERPLGVIEQGERLFLIDQEALQKKINLNCMACTQKYQYGCCCGSPCNMSRKNHERFMAHEAAMGEMVKKFNRENYIQIQQTGGFIALDGTINEVGGHCALLIKEGKSYVCVPHKYALEQAMPIYDICPLSCLMYPLEIMILETHKKRRLILLTSVVEEDFANLYGRWGSYKSLGIDLKCIDVLGHDEVFKLKDYQPVYEVNKGLLTHEFGVEIYKHLTHFYL